MSLLFPVIIACPTCHCGPALVCGQPSCVWSWWPLMLAPWSATLPDSQRRPLLHLSASYLSMRPWRNCFIWANSTLSTYTTTWTTSHYIRECSDVVVIFVRLRHAYIFLQVSLCLVVHIVCIILEHDIC